MAFSRIRLAQKPCTVETLACSSWRRMASNDLLRRGNAAQLGGVEPIGREAFRFGLQVHHSLAPAHVLPLYFVAQHAIEHACRLEAKRALGGNQVKRALQKFWVS